MALEKYCFCYPWEAGVTLIGMMQLNAALFFWAQFSTLDSYYYIIHLIAALVYTFRVIAFFLWLADDTVATRVQYYNWHSYSFGALGAAGVAIIVMRWIEWDHIPTWKLVSWVLNMGFNVYHIFSLKEFSETPIVKSAAEVREGEEDDVVNLISKNNMNELRQRAIAILANSME